MTHLRWMVIYLKEGREKNFESKYDVVNAKDLNQRSTQVCIFSYVEEEKI